MVQMVREVLKTNALAYIKNKTGFTFLELIAVLVIIGIVGGIAVPNLARLRPSYERDTFVATMQTLVRRGWQEAVVTHQMQRIFLDLEKRLVTLSRDTGKRDKSGTPIYEQLSNTFIASSYQWPESLQLKDFFVDGVDMFHVRGTRITHIFFFIFPSGTSQEVITNWFDQNDTRESEAGTRFSLMISPLTAKMTESYGFSKPAA